MKSSFLKKAEDIPTAPAIEDQEQETPLEDPNILPTEEMTQENISKRLEDISGEAAKLQESGESPEDVAEISRLEEAFVMARSPEEASEISRKIEDLARKIGIEPATDEKVDLDPGVSDVSFEKEDEADVAKNGLPHYYAVTAAFLLKKEDYPENIKAILTDISKVPNSTELVDLLKALENSGGPVDLLEAETKKYKGSIGLKLANAAASIYAKIEKDFPGITEGRRKMDKSAIDSFMKEVERLINSTEIDLSESSKRKLLNRFKEMKGAFYAANRIKPSVMLGGKLWAIKQLDLPDAEKTIEQWKLKQFDVPGEETKTTEQKKEKKVKESPVTSEEDKGQQKLPFGPGKQLPLSEEFAGAGEVPPTEEIPSEEAIDESGQGLLPLGEKPKSMTSPLTEEELEAARTKRPVLHLTRRKKASQFFSLRAYSAAPKVLDFPTFLMNYGFKIQETDLTSPFIHMMVSTEKSVEGDEGAYQAEIYKSPSGQTMYVQTSNKPTLSKKADVDQLEDMKAAKAYLAPIVEKSNDDMAALQANLVNAINAEEMPLSGEGKSKLLKEVSTMTSKQEISDKINNLYHETSQVGTRVTHSSLGGDLIIVAINDGIASVLPLKDTLEGHQIAPEQFSLENLKPYTEFAGIKEGSEISHPAYGHGVILKSHSIEGRHAVDVRFDNGIRIVNLSVNDLPKASEAQNTTLQIFSVEKCPVVGQFTILTADKVCSQCGYKHAELLESTARQVEEKKSAAEEAQLIECEKQAVLVDVKSGLKAVLATLSMPELLGRETKARSNEQSRQGIAEEFSMADFQAGVKICRANQPSVRGIVLYAEEDNDALKVQWDNGQQSVVWPQEIAKVEETSVIVPVEKSIEIDDGYIPVELTINEPEDSGHVQP